MAGATQVVVEVGPVELSWDPEVRLARLRFTEPGTGGGPEAERLTAQLASWVDEGGGGPFRLLVDCSEMVDVDAAWRTTWGNFFKEERDRSTIGWFNASARIRLVIIMFKKGTGVTGEAFESESEARAYLEQAVAPS
jgi:hypothetical protein